MYRCRSRQILGGCKRFLPEYLQSCPKSLCATFVYKFSPTNIMNNFFGYELQKKSSCVCVFFCKRWAHFLKSNNVGRHFCPDFLGFCPNFPQIKTLGVRLHALHPASYTTIAMFPAATGILRRGCISDTWQRLAKIRGHSAYLKGIKAWRCTLESHICVQESYRSFCFAKWDK